MFGLSRQFRQLLQEKWHEMYRVSYAWTHDPALAADLVQETMARCLKNTEKFSDPEDVKIWLYTVMRNCWRDHLRKQKPQLDISEVDIQDKTNPEQAHYQNQIMRHVKHAFGEMTHEHREILSLVAMEGFSYESVAKILDIPTGTVMSRLSRARNSLKELLSEVDLPDNISASTLWRVK